MNTTFTFDFTETNKQVKYCYGITVNKCLFITKQNENEAIVHFVDMFGSQIDVPNGIVIYQYYNENPKHVRLIYPIKNIYLLNRSCNYVIYYYEKLCIDLKKESENQWKFNIG
jgi:hypothetical protein